MRRLECFSPVLRVTALALALTAALPAAARPLQPARLDANGSPGDVYFKQITLDEAAQFISQIGKTSIVVTSSVANKKVSLYLRDVNVEGMVRSLSRAAGVWYRYDSQTKAYILMDAKEYQQDIAITRDEITRNYMLRHNNVVSIANAIAALYGERVNLVEPVEEMPPLEMGSTARTQTGSTGSRSSGMNGASGGMGLGGGSSRGFSMSPEGATTRRSGGSRGVRQMAGKDPRTEIANVSQAGLEASLDIDGSAVMRVEASELQQAVSNQGPPINITYNKQHNLLLVRTSDEAALKDIDKLVTDMDHPPRQVLLEMRILEVELGGDFRSVFDIGLSGNSTTRVRDNGTSGPYGLNHGSDIDGSVAGGYPRNAASLGNFGPEETATAVWQLVSDTLRLRLQMLESENRVNVLATPMLVASNNQPARLFIGDEQILITGAESDSTTGTTGANNTTITVETERRNVGQTLIILPRINADRSVTLTVDQDNSRINAGGARMPLPLPNGETFDYPIDTVNTANLQVTAHARDGLTVAVGGMISQRVSDAEEKVPLLGDIPGLGVLFKKKVKSNVRKQIVLLITPHVLETPEESDTLARGKEAEVRSLDAGGSSQGLAATAKPEKRDSMFDPAFGLAAAAGGATPAAAPPAAAAASSNKAELERLGGLARAAADAVRQEDPTAPPPGDLQPVHLPIAARQTRQLGDDLEFQAVAAWQKDGYYITALRVINLNARPATLTPTRIVGRWAAMVVERKQLDAAGGERSWTWAYAISHQPYEQAVEQP
ncbi:MAG: hypothetical protein LBI92_03305 [Azoarcus sp.]|jgi:general secretion pathway protein D|nr:hypothetical protein [Azoarcus sp.]